MALFLASVRYGPYSKTEWCLREKLATINLLLWRMAESAQRFQISEEQVIAWDHTLLDTLFDFQLSKTNYYYYYYYYYYSLWVLHISISWWFCMEVNDSKSPEVSGIFLSILTYLKNATVYIVSIHPFISSHSSLFPRI